SNVPTHESQVVYYGAHTGFYKLRPAENVLRPPGTPDFWEIAANFSSVRESNITPMEEPLPTQEPVKAPEQEKQSDPRLQEWAWVLDYFVYDIWLYCIFAILGLLTLEALTYHRRWTV
ncbi:MAG: hypothetical protein RBU37_24960, partial [Myxococcota bacterium]|nr:hypothetical protein [Myxococcota bacterium]